MSMFRSTLPRRPVVAPTLSPVLVTPPTSTSMFRSTVPRQRPSIIPTPRRTQEQRKRPQSPSPARQQHHTTPTTITTTTAGPTTNSFFAFRVPRGPGTDKPVDTRLQTEMQQTLVPLLVRPAQPKPAPEPTDWSLPHNAERMNGAIKSWFEEKTLKKKKRALRQHAKAHCVPYETFRKRIKQEDPLRLPQRGRPGLFNKDDKEAIVDAVAALSHLHAGKDTTAIVQMLHEHNPQYTHKQLTNVWHNTIKRTGNVLQRTKAQASDKCRTGAITEFSQRFYFALVDEAQKECIRKSSDRDTNGLDYADLEDHFVMNLDEDCQQASLGSSHVVSDASLSKAEKNQVLSLALSLFHTSTNTHTRTQRTLRTTVV